MNGFVAMSLALAVSLGITALLGFVLIPWLHKLKFGQVILDIGPNWHKHKQGTPTMGGLMFIIGILLAIAVVLGIDFFLLGGRSMMPLSGGVRWRLLAGVGMAAAFGLLGFLDDYTKVVKKRNKGLSIAQKSVMQIIIIGGYLLVMILSMQGSPSTLIPFVGRVGMPGWLFVLFGAVGIYAFVNAVNFTDGIDGLCSSVTVITGTGLAVFAVMRGLFGAGVLTAALVGGCVGFLLWNRPPAKVFMGDTGSMFIGGLLLAIAFALETPVILLPMGIIYVIEFLSDVIQIGYFKATRGKRVFKMAPIHHHFEMSGWSEKKIDVVFCVINAIGVAVGLGVVYFGLRGMPGFVV
ncbi:MAG: phospho-N-acetylmuramoyl-pentapeptide-transferase [Oscillospiraceae bacterium]|nr:phospho-N-acetylmuramoyl-pentapeptide-transferase [Oscillospiraceae bacterium]